MKGGDLPLDLRQPEENISQINDLTNKTDSAKVSQAARRKIYDFIKV